MSAFTPYKNLKDLKNDQKVNSDFSNMINNQLITNSLIKFPLNLLLTIPNYRINSFSNVEKKESDKNEKFFMKNILRNDDDKNDKDVKQNKVEFEEHASRMETIVSNLGKSDNGHRCIYCGKIYSRKYGLKIHIRTHTGYKPLKCKYCSRPFGDPSNLNKHVRLHAQGQTPYKCQFCHKILVRRRDLERHVKSRHNQ